MQFFSIQIIKVIGSIINALAMAVATCLHEYIDTLNSSNIALVITNNIFPLLPTAAFW